MLLSPVQILKKEFENITTVGITEGKSRKKMQEGGKKNPYRTSGVCTDQKNVYII